MCMFRDLRADEIECRVAQARENGISLLLYKDARCDQTILDETVGEFGWQRSHTRDNANCVVSIWDGKKNQWISKEDTGTESNTEKEKGLASDSFKRACFNWGIGRELYTAPFIWIKAADCTELKQNKDRWQCFDTFKVENIEIENKRIREISIINVKSRKRCFFWKDTQLSSGQKRTPAASTDIDEVAKIDPQKKSDEDAQNEKQQSIYAAAMEATKTLLGTITDAESANAAIPLFKSIPHALTSEKESSRLWMWRMKELGLFYDNVLKQYTDAPEKGDG